MSNKKVKEETIEEILLLDAIKIQEPAKKRKKKVVKEEPLTPEQKRKKEVIVKLRELSKVHGYTEVEDDNLKGVKQ